MYLEHCEKLDWQWTDGGLPYAIMDYHSCVGSILDFTDNDWQAAEENGFSREEVITLYRNREDKQMTKKDTVNVLYRDGYHVAAKLIEKKSKTIESRKFLILWKDDFISENKWRSLCVALDVPEDTVTLELKCNVVAVFPYKE